MTTQARREAATHVDRRPALNPPGQSLRLPRRLVSSPSCFHAFLIETLVPRDGKNHAILAFTRETLFFKDGRK